MKICVLYKDIGNSSSCRGLAEALAKGITQQGHSVDVLNINDSFGKNLSIYNYIALGTKSSSFFGGKIDPDIEKFLTQCGSISGKRSFAFICKGALRSGKTMQTLMRTMEKQGMYLTFSQILTNPAYSEEVGKRLRIS